MSKVKYCIVEPRKAQAEKKHVSVYLEYYDTGVTLMVDDVGVFQLSNEGFGKRVVTHLKDGNDFGLQVDDNSRLTILDTANVNDD